MSITSTAVRSPEPARPPKPAARYCSTNCGLAWLWTKVICSAIGVTPSCSGCYRGTTPGALADGAGDEAATARTRHAAAVSGDDLAPYHGEANRPRAAQP